MDVVTQTDRSKSVHHRYILYTAQNNKGNRSLMSHAIDKICIIMLLISRFVSKVCLLISCETHMQGPSRSLRNCLLNTKSQIFTVIKCICTKNYILNLIHLAFSALSYVMHCHSRIGIKYFRQADQAIMIKQPKYGRRYTDLVEGLISHFGVDCR